MSDEQGLNSLSRFRKDPGRFVLEEHSHCEVPAGCGGVVLRWRQPGAPTAFTVYCYAAGEGAEWRLDGRKLSSGRVDLEPGRQVIACALPAVDRSRALILFAAVADAPEGASGTLKVVSAGDGTWKYALDEPPSNWAWRSFDAGSWPALVARPAPSLADDEPGAYQARQCLRLGAVCLGLTRPGASWWNRLRGRRRVWVHKAFEVPEGDSPGSHP
jgi:hypothetical protein